MKILKHEFEMYDGYANRPTIVLHVDRLPDDSVLRYEERDCIYAAQVDGFVKYFYTDGKPTQGFGGRTIEISMMDGTERTFSGAWSSRAGVVNTRGFGFGDIVDVCFVERDGKYPDLRISGAVTLAALVAEQMFPMIAVTNGGELGYEPGKVDVDGHIVPLKPFCDYTKAA